jgi:hypothetical protein
VWEVEDMEISPEFWQYAINTSPCFAAWRL